MFTTHIQTKNIGRFLRATALAGITLLLCSCSFVPQTQYLEYSERALQTNQQKKSWPAQDGAEAVLQLNHLISSPGLDNLIHEALAANPGLAQTGLSLKILQATRRQATASRLPEISFSASGEKTEASDEEYTSSLTISWELDIWQKLADSEKAAAMDVAEQQALYEAGQNTLVAEVMREWLGLIRDQHAIDIEAQRLENYEKNEGYILQRYRNGIGSLDDLDSARTSTASSRASLEEDQENLAQRKRALVATLGRIESRELAVETSYPSVITPLAELPDQTLRNRPDLKAAYLAIEAASLRTTVAYKDLLPSISISAALGDGSSSPSGLLLGDPVWSLLGQLSAPLFQGGKLKAAVDIAELTTAQRYQAYRETLLTSITEIEEALCLEKSLTKREEHIRSALQSAENSLQRYQKNYRAGLVDILDLLTVQSKTFDLALQLDNLTYLRLTNRIDLGLALGLGVKK